MTLIDALEKAINAALGAQSEGIFALVFFGLSFACGYSLIYQLQIRRWPSAQGKLLKAATEEFGATEFHISDVDYKNTVCYEYVVEGKTYTGDRLSPWVIVATHNLIVLFERQLDGFEQGSQLPVFYNPRKPEKAFLKRPGPVGLLATAAAIVFCFMTPVIIFA